MEPPYVRLAHHTRGRVDTDYPYYPLLYTVRDVRYRTNVVGFRRVFFGRIFRRLTIEMGNTLLCGLFSASHTRCRRTAAVRSLLGEAA